MMLTSIADKVLSKYKVCDYIGVSVYRQQDGYYLVAQDPPAPCLYITLFTS
jgi:hypothetical protein